MIEVTAKLDRGNVFLSGEIIECLISFTYPSSASSKVAQSNTDVVENLAWASAEIHCQCFTDPKIIKSKETEQQKPKSVPISLPESTSHTSLGDIGSESGNAKVEFASKPIILFCDLKLSPGQSKTFTYREKIPPNLPPSYRGQLVKYSYKITIGTQRLHNPVKVMRIPIRVLPLPETVLSEAGAVCNDTAEELTPSNPFLEPKKKETPLYLAIESLQNITARRNPNFYMITNTWGKVCRFCLFKSNYKLGEDIVGTFDFSVATVKCMQVSVTLQCEEETTIDPNEGNATQSRNISYSKHHEVVLGHLYTHLILPVPLHVTPTFSTDLVSLKWRLHFEFVTSTFPGLQPAEGISNWQAPSEVPIETMVWSLPIKLYSTVPSHVAISLSNTEHRLTIK